MLFGCHSTVSIKTLQGRYIRHWASYSHTSSQTKTFSPGGLAMWGPSAVRKGTHYRAGHRRALSQNSIPHWAISTPHETRCWRSAGGPPRDDIRKSLKGLRQARPPDVLLLDATRGLRKGNPSWKANLVKLSTALGKFGVSAFLRCCLSSTNLTFGPNSIKSLRSGRKGTVRRRPGSSNHICPRTESSAR